MPVDPSDAAWALPVHEAGALRIRPVVQAEVPELLDMIRALAEYEREPDAVVADEATLREQLFGARPAAEAVFAELGGQRVGFALFFHNFSTWRGTRGLYLEDLFVQESARGRGVGHALLAYLARLARARGCARMEWWVLDWNADAIGFYGKLGAVAQDDWTVFRLDGAALEALGRD